MINLRLEFPASRYHATPWGRHVNEGVAEWPPSPYRLLRGLYDVWQRKCAHLSEASVRSVLEALASCDPNFLLPSASAAHTRSYLSSNSVDPTDKNLVFDAFLVFDRQAECYVSWPDVTLDEEQHGTLRELLRNLNYLGRSESWVSAGLHDGPVKGDFRCEPLSRANYGGEATRVACVVPATEYSGKRDWMAALTTSTTEVLKSKASAPPLLKQVRYVRPPECIDTDPPRKTPPRDIAVQAVVLGLAGPVLPLATATIEVAEQIRTRLMGAHRKRMDDDPSKVSPLFSGKNKDGSKRLDHGHLYILPQANESSRINRVLLLSRSGPFKKDDELDAVRGVQELYQADSRPKVRCVVVWQGALDDVVAGPRRTIFESSTPFVTVRHMRRGRELDAFLEAEIRRECRNHGMQQPVTVQRKEDLPGLFHIVEYRRNRKGDAPRPGYAFRLQFAEPIAAPFSLGYGSHFGLGQFRGVG
jgi:CRISPR-associated protein Csb2